MCFLSHLGCRIKCDLLLDVFQLCGAIMLLFLHCLSMATAGDGWSRVQGQHMAHTYSGIAAPGIPQLLSYVYIVTIMCIDVEGLVKLPGLQQAYTSLCSRFHG